MNDIPLDLYRVFYHVAQEGGFSRAAQRLHISQSAVSQSVKKLEQQLGHRLLTRNSRRIGLTAEGRRLLPRVREAILSLEEIGRQFDTDKTKHAGTVRLGAGDTVFRYYLLDILKRFHAAYPAIRFQVTNRTSEPLTRMMREGTLDLAIVSRPQDTPPDPALRPFAEMTYVFAATKELAYKFDGFSSSAGELPVLLPEKGTTARRILDAYCAEQDIALNPEIELESVDLLTDLARAGLGAAYVPEQCARPFLEKGELRLLPGVSLSHSLMLYLPEEALIPPCARLFVKALTE